MIGVGPLWQDSHCRLESTQHETVQIAFPERG
jgi:hypothetical protein